MIRAEPPHDALHLDLLIAGKKPHKQRAFLCFTCALLTHSKAFRNCDFVRGFLKKDGKNALYFQDIDGGDFYLQSALHHPHFSHLDSGTFVFAVRKIFVQYLRSVFEFVFRNPMAQVRRD